jgi:cyclohexa-1,5-dienecarbonyl-CoA hydratase
MSFVKLDLNEKVAWLTLERPPLNILDIPMLTELSAALDELHSNPDATVVVLSGAGERAFCAGVDVRDHTPDKVRPMIDAFHGALRRLARLPQVTVAAVDGVALGGGLELALLCDLCVTSARSRFALPEIQLACFPPVALAALQTVCGRAVASDLILTGEPVSAERAVQIGLASRLFPTERFDESLRALVAGLTDKSASVLKLTGQSLRAVLLRGFEERLAQAERTYLELLVHEPDMAEGITAFIEKRPPRFQR